MQMCQKKQNNSPSETTVIALIFYMKSVVQLFVKQRLRMEKCPSSKSIFQRSQILGRNTGFKNHCDSALFWKNRPLADEKAPPRAYKG